MTVDSTLAPVAPPPAPVVPPTAPVVPPTAPVVPPLVEEGQPFGGTSATVPGTIEAEEFDEGGQHVAYYDSTPGNKKGVRTKLLLLLPSLCCCCFCYFFLGSLINSSPNHIKCVDTGPAPITPEVGA